MASGEFRAVFYSSGLSVFGDSIARAAVTALVYQHTRSALLSAVTFAISFLPWLGVGPVLSALAERHPYRRTMVVCDLARMVTIGLVALPRIPVAAVLALLFVTALFEPPFKAARSALNPRILEGERYVLSVSMLETTTQMALILGYFTGGAIAAYDPRMALLFDAATFGISACIVGLRVHHREPALTRDRRSNLLRETAEGFAVVFGGKVLRSLATVVFAALLFPVIPEGLAAAWAGHLAADPHTRGWAQGLIMCSMPAGFALGSVLINRLVQPSTRQHLIRPFAVIAPLVLVGALADPAVYGVAAIGAVSGFATAAMIPSANGLFVQALPDRFRARAFGVMASGVQLCQGAAVFVTGALASRADLPLVVGLWGVAGTVLMLFISITWPSAEGLAEAIRRARQANEETGGASPAQAAAATRNGASVGRHRARADQPGASVGRRAPGGPSASGGRRAPGGPGADAGPSAPGGPGADAVGVPDGPVNPVAPADVAGGTALGEQNSRDSGEGWSRLPSASH
nr:MFS transporter [Planosporangium thailandense]